MVIAALLFCVPTLTVLHQTVIRGRQWWDRRRLHLADAESAADRLYRMALIGVPERSVVGLVVTPATSPIDKSRTMYLMQYALAPRSIVLSADAPWVVLAGLLGPDDHLLDERRFVLVSSPREDLRLYRRTTP
jgi:hypothetical protein